MDTGAIIVAGIEKTNVIAAVVTAVTQWSAGNQAERPADYRVENTSQRVVNLIVGLSRLHAEWSGVRPVQP
jgi:UDP-N-acetylglucosamine 2-epimerase (non-hydrolysing)